MRTLLHALATTAVLVTLSGCGGAATLDPLAPVPTQVRPEEIAEATLRSAWSFKFLDPEDDDEPQVPTHAGAVGESYAFVPYADRVIALDLLGEEVWSLRLVEPLAFAPLAYQGGIALATETGWFWVDATGAPAAFLERLGSPRDAIVGNDAVYLTTAAAVHAVTLPTQAAFEVRWTTELAGANRVVLGPDASTLYVVADDGAVSALDAASGVVRWRSHHVDAGPMRPAAGTSIYIIDREGRLHALRARDGAKAWTGKDIGLKVTGSPITADGVVWVPGLDGAVHGFTASAGSHLFRVPASGRVYLDLVQWGPWVIASPQYGPWLLLHGPRRTSGPADPGSPRREVAGPTNGINRIPAAGPAGVLIIDAEGEVHLLTQQRGIDRDPDGS